MDILDTCPRFPVAGQFEAGADDGEGIRLSADTIAELEVTERRKANFSVNDKYMGGESVNCVVYTRSDKISAS